MEASINPHLGYCIPLSNDYASHVSRSTIQRSEDVPTLWDGLICGSSHPLHPYLDTLNEADSTLNLPEVVSVRTKFELKRLNGKDCYVLLFSKIIPKRLPAVIIRTPIALMILSESALMDLIPRRHLRLDIVREIIVKCPDHKLDITSYEGHSLKLFVFLKSTQFNLQRSGNLQGSDLDPPPTCYG